MAPQRKARSSRKLKDEKSNSILETVDVKDNFTNNDNIVDDLKKTVEISMYDSEKENQQDLPNSPSSKPLKTEDADSQNTSFASSTISMDQSEENSRSSLDNDCSSEVIITDSIIAAEEECQRENQSKVSIDQEKAVEEIRGMEQNQRFARLQHLLTCSNIYAQFLLERMQKQREEAKKSTPAKPEPTQSTEANDASKTTSPGRRSKRKRKENSHYRVEDYVTEEALKKQVKKRKTEDGSEKQVVPVETESKLSVKDSFCRDIEGDKVSDRQPALFTGGVLRPYQLDGMEWLKGLFENGINGILGDEMGLGKTVQVIALFAFLIEKGIQGPFLVVAPLSTLSNWVNEFKRFTPEVYSLLYHGKKDDRLHLRKKLRMRKGQFKSFPVVITSYQMILSDTNVLGNFKWKYIVVDEAQRLKNMNCKLILELKRFHTANRLLLSGTPLQNDLSELWSLLNFLLPDIFDDLSSFQAWFDFNAISEEGGDQKIIAQEQEEHVLQTLHSILTPFLLRRLKCDVELKLPPKKEVVVYAKMAALQDKLYTQCLDKTIAKKLKAKCDEEEEDATVDLETGRKNRRCKENVDYTSIVNDDANAVDFYEKICKKQSDLASNKQEEEENKKKNSEDPDSVLHIKTMNVSMMLRNCCNHPYLIEFPLDKETKDYRIDEGVVQNSGKMRLLDQMLVQLKARGHKVLIFSQMTSMLDIIGYYLQMRGYRYSTLDGRMNFEDRELQIKEFNEDPEVFCFLLSTRAGGLGLNLMAADTAIIYDSDWNPQCDLQAQDRCHRIGQTKPVVIYRFLVKNSIDETMFDIASKKRKLEKMVIHKDHFKGKETAKPLTKSQLTALLENSDRNWAVSSDDKEKPLTEEALEQLLDRSDLLGKKMKATTSNHDDIFKVVESKESLQSFNTTTS